jgi:hypothetical protein
VMNMNIHYHRVRFDSLIARNGRLRRLFLFDARQMLLSRAAMNGCADECGVVWPYALVGDDLVDVNVTAAPDNVETIRAEFAAVVEERHRRAAPAVKRRRTNR